MRRERLPRELRTYLKQLESCLVHGMPWHATQHDLRIAHSSFVLLYNEPARVACLDAPGRQAEQVVWQMQDAKGRIASSPLVWAQGVQSNLNTTQLPRGWNAVIILLPAS